MWLSELVCIRLSATQFETFQEIGDFGFSLGSERSERSSYNVHPTNSKSLESERKKTDFRGLPQSNPKRNSESNFLNLKVTQIVFCFFGKICMDQCPRKFVKSCPKTGIGPWMAIPSNTASQPQSLAIYWISDKLQGISVANGEPESITHCEKPSATSSRKNWLEMITSRDAKGILGQIKAEKDRVI